MPESVKGSLLVGAVVAVRRLRNQGRIPAESLEARLSREALELVDRKIEIARWYPVRAFCELLDLDWEIAGRRAPAYLEQQGAASADRLFDSKRYQQLEYAERSGKVESPERLLRQTRLITTITASFYDFLEFQAALEAGHLCIVYGNAQAFETPLVHTTVGFMNQINVRQGSQRRWAAERTRPDEVRFRMPLPKRMAGEA
jgi:hypothetical protein